MSMKYSFLMAGAALALASVGCAKETIDSQNIKTAGIAAIMDVTATSATSATVHVDLKTGGDESNTFVILSSGDRLVATAGGEEKTMQAVDDGEYEASFGTGAADTEVVVRLEREADDPAPNSRGTLPAPFDIASPADGDSMSRAEAMTVTWDAGSGADSVTIEFDGDCIFVESIDVPGDSGSYSVAAGTLKPTDSKDPGTCDVTMKVSRARGGSADPAFDAESSFVLHQDRWVTFTSKP